MKGGKKQKFRGMKQKVREEKTRERSIGLAVAVAILIVILCISGILINSMINQPSTGQTFSPTLEPKAAIVDHLSLTRPNKTFIETATDILKQANYTVDYYPGEKVTVEFYRNLPTHGYDMIILRVHSALACQRGRYEPPVALFTSEPYSLYKYVSEQLAEQLTRTTYSVGDEEHYFGIVPNFVKSCMNGNFQNTVIIVMGCNGLTFSDMADAFTEKGAKTYIGWSDAILGTRNDPAITRLLEHLITEKQTIENAIMNTMKEFEPTQTDYSVLRYHPLEVGNQAIEDIRSGQ
jgi:hypothetical protein